MPQLTLVEPESITHANVRRLRPSGDHEAETGNREGVDDHHSSQTFLLQGVSAPDSRKSRLLQFEADHRASVLPVGVDERSIHGTNAATAGAEATVTPTLPGLEPATPADAAITVGHQDSQLLDPGPQAVGSATLTAARSTTDVER
ncbi:hypothetical protein Nm8I071_39100 [Nonomuraea sp. TT08I-71]|nr:hypothetical protein Nm8I071_39100 [Nonomuraea sp. TT08I-71]